MTKNPTIDEILEAVRIGGWYDANPNQREPGYMGTDVAKQAICDLLLSKLPKKHYITNPQFPSHLDKPQKLLNDGYNQAVDDMTATINQLKGADDE